MTADIWDQLQCDKDIRCNLDPDHGGVCRGHLDRPLVIPEGGGKPVYYSRVTTLAGTLDDGEGLRQWHGANVALGLVARPELILAIAAHQHDRGAVYSYCRQAATAGGGDAAALTGTSLHKLAERLGNGEPRDHVLAGVPEEYHADVDAWMSATAHLGFRRDDIERFVVNDQLKVGGTADLIVSYGGKRFILDIKSGAKQMDYPHKMTLQLAIYANSQTYDPDTGRRGSLGAIDKRWAICAHLPAGTGRCNLHWVPIHEAWTQAVKLATDVKAWRATKILTREWVKDINPTKSETGAIA